MRARSWSTIVFCVFFFFLNFATANADQSLRIEQLSTFASTWGTTNDVVIEGNYAFFADEDSGLKIVDVSSPNVPVETGCFSWPSGFVTISVSNDMVFLGGNDGMLIVDVSDPSSPSFVNYLELYQTNCLYAIDNTVYLGYGGGLMIIDVSNPYFPQLLGSLYVYNPYGLEVVDGYAYIAAYSHGLVIIDVSDPTTPTLVTEYPTGSAAYMLDIEGQYAYIADLTRLTVIDISDPLSPQLSGICNLPNAVWDVEVANETAFLTSINGFYYAVSVTQPNLPILAGTFEFSEPALSSFLMGDVSIVALSAARFSIVDISDPASMSESYRHISPTHSIDIDISGDYVYISDEDGVICYDISNLPVQYVCDIPSERSTEVSIAEGDYLYTFVDREGVYIYDIADPYSYQLVNSFQILDDYYRAYDMTIHDNKFVVSTRDSLYLYLHNSPESIILQSTIDINGQLLIQDNLLYVSSSGTGLLIYDISDLTNPIEIGSYLLPFTNWELPFEVVGNTGYIYSGHTTVYTLDLTDLSTPILVGSFELISLPLSLQYSDGYLFVSEYDNTLEIFNTLDLLNIEQTGYYRYENENIHGLPRGSFEIVNDMVFYNTGESTHIYSCSAAIEPLPLLELELTAVDPLYVQQGGEFSYDALLRVNLPSPNTIDIWTEAVLSNGNRVGPIDVPRTYMWQDVPSYAPLTDYIYVMKTGIYPNTTVAMDSFPFSVLPGSTRTSPLLMWSASNYEISFYDALEGNNIASSVPNVYRLESVYPNPFNAMTTVRVALPETVELSVVVYNVTGQRVATLAAGSYDAGTHALTFDASNLASGLYFVRATVPGQLEQTQKVMLIQ